jgi:hypothetical protein
LSDDSGGRGNRWPMTQLDHAWSGRPIKPAAWCGVIDELATAARKMPEFLIDYNICLRNDR